MKANELRIGNWVEIDYGIKTYVTAIWHDGVWVGEQIRRNMSEIQPIPITEEWLVTLNFKKVINESKYNEWHNFGLLKESICIEFDDSGCYFTGGEGIYYSKNIKYVHQLQNLYFALTGEELTIKE